MHLQPRLFIFTMGLLLLSITTASSQTAESGRVRYVKRQDPQFNRYTDNPTTNQQQWMRDNIWRLGVYSPYFDSKLNWFPNAWLYLDLYAIYKDSPLVSQHPEWILKDIYGNRLFIPWGCSGGTCPQYAGDVSNPAFRRYWIDQAKAKLAKGYKGIWLDDVNMMFRVGNGNQVEVPPFDNNTNGVMTYNNWRKYVAEFVEQIAAELTTYEILHNCIWFGGPSGIRDQDAYVKRQLAAADYINLERGFTDEGLTGGTGEWSLSAFMAFVDRVHAMGKAVVFDEYYPPNMEYTLAGYFLLSRDRDGLGDLASTPDNWYPGYDVELGAPLGNRYLWNSLSRRDFVGGIVLLNEPGAPSRTVTLPGTFRTISGSLVTSVTLPAKGGAVLGYPTSQPVTPPTTSVGTYYVADMNWVSATNGYGPVEKNMSVGGQGAGDGRRITLNGVPYTRGLGVHAESQVKYKLGGVCSSFLAVAGVDDESGSSGSVIFQVWADGAKLWESGVMTGAGASQNVNVSVGGRNELTLIATSAGDGLSWDHADWADARLTCSSAPPVVTTSSLGGYVSDRSWVYSTNGWGPTEKDKSNGESAPGDGRTLTLNGATFAKGLGMHAPAEVRYTLNGACSSFDAVVGVDDEVGAYGSIVFQVWADGIKLYDSGVMAGSGASKNVSVPLAGRRELSLILTTASDGLNSDHGDWGNARLTCQ